MGIELCVYPQVLWASVYWVACNECLEEGSIPVIEFAKPVVTGAGDGVSVPDLFWNCGDIESGDRGIDHVVSVIADGMDLSSTDTFPIMRAKRLSDFEVCITVDAEGDVEWKWAEPEQEESQ